MESDSRYYARRAAEERRAAQRALTDNARLWHSELAATYMMKLEQSELNRLSVNA